MALDHQERRAVESTLRRFAGRIETLLFASEAPDGDLARIPQLLEEARAMDIIADPAPGAPGHDLGVWGRCCWDEGLTLSLLTLSILGESCAGFASAVHAQGLACLALEQPTPLTPATPMAAAFMPHYGLPLNPLIQPNGSGLQLSETPDGCSLSGTSYFLLAATEPRKIVCFGQTRAHPEWVSLLLSSSAPGVTLSDVGPRTGLRAVHQYHLHCQETVIRPEQILQRGAAAERALQRLLACDWLGGAAIALGVVRRLLHASRAYTAQRYQGGRMIEDHPAIQLLQGTAEYDLALLKSTLDQHASEPLNSLDITTLLRWAVTARLALVEHAHRAATNCLQTAGGYGYMEDYGFEKRLRDVSTLKSLHGTPDQLKILMNHLSRRE